jgi:hypothetical protein
MASLLMRKPFIHALTWWAAMQRQAGRLQAAEANKDKNEHAGHSGGAIKENWPATSKWSAASHHDAGSDGCFRAFSDRIVNKISKANANNCLKR